MKTLIHKLASPEICIYENDCKFLRGSFFADKPEVGDIIMSFAVRESNYMHKFEVLSIIQNRDSKISSSCTLNPSKSYFELEIANITEDERFASVKNNIDLALPN